jgi:hypothetical protein
MQSNLDILDAIDLTGQLDTIQDALLAGLAAYGEIERLLCYQDIEEASGRTIEESRRVIHPTGDAATVSLFASALTLLQHMRPAVKWAHHDPDRQKRREVIEKAPQEVAA